MYLALAHAQQGSVTVTSLTDGGEVIDVRVMPAAELAGFVESVEAPGRTTTAAVAGRDAPTAVAEATPPRWVWDSTALWYPPLLAAGVRVQRCVDLTLCHTILRASTVTASSALAHGEDDWVPPDPFGESEPRPDAVLFDWEGDPAVLAAQGRAGLAPNARSHSRARPDPVPEFRRQLAAVNGADQPGRIRLLLAAESAGALVAAEMRHAGLPWRADVHERLLTELLGPRVPHGVRPDKLERLAVTIRRELGVPGLNPDSQSELLRALRGAGLAVASTRAWELRELSHPAIAPLLQYKKLSRLLSANGWSWMDAWVVDGRFHSDYLPGAVVTGRWATRGGGALQLPKQIRGAVVADPGWKLVVADAAQLEPRILAALSADTAMAAAGRGHDLYDGIVAAGAIDTRAHAKVAMLGAMYGATTGDSARLMPRLERAYPRALALVEDAARTGERGGIVTTWLGRSSPAPGEGWLAVQARASEPDSTAADERTARGQARDWGRFTRNFVVQGSAAEWALCWLAQLRRTLDLLDGPGAAGASPAPFTARPHLAFFLHDEVIVHVPEALAERVALEVRDAAAEAGRLLFGDFPVEFALTIAVVDTYAEAK